MTDQVAELLKRVEQLEETLKQAENFEPEVEFEFADIVFEKIENGKFLNVEETEATPQLRIYGGLSHGNSGFPRWRNYNLYGGYVWLELNGKPLIWRSIETGTHVHKPPVWDRVDHGWRYHAAGTDKCLFGFAGRHWGSHRAYSTWAVFLDEHGNGWRTRFSYG